MRWNIRFQLSLRDIEELLFERGVIVSYAANVVLFHFTEACMQQAILYVRVAFLYVSVVSICGWRSYILVPIFCKHRPGHFRSVVRR